MSTTSPSATRTSIRESTASLRNRTRIRSGRSNSMLGSNPSAGAIASKENSDPFQLTVIDPPIDE